MHPPALSGVISLGWLCPRISRVCRAVTQVWVFLGTLGGPRCCSHHTGCLEQISVSQIPKKLLRGLAATDFRGLNKKQGMGRAGTRLELTPASLMFPDPAVPSLSVVSDTISGDRWQDEPLLTSQPTCLIVLSPPKSYTRSNLEAL